MTQKYRDFRMLRHMLLILCISLVNGCAYQQPAQSADENKGDVAAYIRSSIQNDDYRFDAETTTSQLLEHFPLDSLLDAFEYSERSNLLILIRGWTYDGVYPKEPNSIDMEVGPVAPRSICGFVIFEDSDAIGFSSNAQITETGSYEVKADIPSDFSSPIDHVVPTDGRILQSSIRLPESDKHQNPPNWLEDQPDSLIDLYDSLKQVNPASTISESWGSGRACIIYLRTPDGNRAVLSINSYSDQSSPFGQIGRKAVGLWVDINDACTIHKPD